MLDFLALLISGIIFGFTLAFGVGANDVANTFGTTIGSEAISIVPAFVLASIFETIGAVFLGGGVVKAISKNVIDISLFEPYPDLLMLGYLSALISSTIWLITASLLKLPVSATQSAVGSMVGMGIVVLGFDVVNWGEIITIILSWIISPVLSGIISALMYFLLKATVFIKENPRSQLNRVLMLMPLFYFLSVGLNVFATLFQRQPTFLPEDWALPWWSSICFAGGFASVSAVLVGAFYVPYLRRRVHLKQAEREKSEMARVHADNPWLANPVPSVVSSVSASVTNLDQMSDCEDKPHAKQLPASPFYPSVKQENLLNRLMHAAEWPGLFETFWMLQITISCFGAMAHGGNDVANAIAPVTGMYEIYNTGKIPSKATKPDAWILFYGGIGITVGLWALGRRVVKTIGKQLASITPPRGFVVELGTTTTVLFANQIGIPISTTFCKVGSIIFVGMVNGVNEVSWRLLFMVVMAWVFTLPISGVMSALIMAALQSLFYYGPVGPATTALSIVANVTTTAVVGNF